MNVIFTCGGTAGHVNPALALAGYMQERHPDLRVLFVGTPCGMERGLIEKAGYDFRSIEVSSFQRSLSPSGIAHNVKSLKIWRWPDPEPVPSSGISAPIWWWVPAATPAIPW